MVDKEQEIRLQFLDEAGEYLDTLETALLGVAQRGVDSHEINGALRAAHSIKGGAALMGYQLTSELAHRLEDSLKVLKIQRGEGVTSDVEAQMLGGVDAIRQIVERDRTGTPAEEAWVNSAIIPIFDGLYDTLGEPSAEDAASIMDADEGQNVMPLIFQTEVEGSLERLELLIGEQPPDLQAEVATMAQELSGLGEMLDLPPFIQLCQSVERYALGASSSAQVKEVAEKTLQVWRRAQALVMTDNVDSMPNQLSGVSFGLIDIELGQTLGEGAGFTGDSEIFERSDRPLSDQSLENLEQTDWDALGEEDDALVGNVFAGLGDEDDALVGDVFSGLGTEADVEENRADANGFGTGLESVSDLEADPEASRESTTEEDVFASVFEEAPGDRTGENSAFSTGTFGQSVAPGGRSSKASAGPSSGSSAGGGTQFRFSEAPKPQADDPDLGDNTVRVSVRKLNELNDYFGEMTIERNRLEAEVKRMRSLVGDLSRRLRTLDEINDDVRDIYEQPGQQLLLSAGKTLNALPGAGLTAKATTAMPSTASAAIPDTSTVGTEAVGTTPASTDDNKTNRDGINGNGTDGSGGDHSGANGNDAYRQSFDSLEFDRYNDAHLPFRQIVESVVRLQEVADDIELSVDKTEQTTRVIHRTARHLQRNLNQLRMRPLSDVTNRFPRALRELELKHGKSVELVLDGEAILIDRNILESLNDPLMHIVRNAFDHGIEVPESREQQGKEPKGTIAIKAANRGGRTVITVSDDGNGIDLEKIRDRARSMGLDAELLEEASESELLSLIFEPGFSTSEEVTALSGRGVGMDVVRNNLTQVRGDISVDTKPGEGTIFTISVPYSLSVTRVMLAEGNRMPVALPTDMIEEVTVLDDADMYETDGRPMFHYKGDAVRLIRLSNWLAFNCTRQIDSLDEVPNMDGPSTLIFRMGDQRVGLQIDRSWGDQEVAVRRVEGPIALPPGFSNCTILGDGKVIPLVNLPDLARWVFNCEGSNIHSAEALYSNPVVNGGIDALSLQAMPKEVSHAAKFLVIDDSVNVRRLLALTLEKAGYEVEQARDGQDAFEKLDTGLKIDGIVCDVEMPRMDGYSFLSKLRSLPQYAQTPVTMLTSRSGDKHRKLAMNLGATAYFSKPYQERVLLKSLKESLTAAAK